MPANWVDIGVNARSMEGYLTQPEGEGSHPAVVVIQEIWGVNSHSQSVVDRPPPLGYVGLAAAMFHREGPHDYRTARRGGHGHRQDAEPHRR